MADKSDDHSTNSSSSSSEDEKPEYASVDDVKDRILLAALEHVPKYGWTKRAIAEGAQSAGYPGVSSGLFGSAAELVQFFNARSNDLLDEELKQIKIEKPVEVVRTAIEARLKMIKPYLRHWPQAQALLLLPNNVPKASSNLRRLLDIVCQHAGYQSADMTWYSRRLSLAAVYKSTELAFISDKSPGFVETWAFLDRRIQDFDSFRSVESAICNSGNVLRGGRITIFNMLGTNHFNTW